MDTVSILSKRMVIECWIETRIQSGMQLPDPEQFNFKDCIIVGDECWLITPKDMATRWDDSNAHFRSCILRKSDHKVISLGFLKFVNWGEKPDFQPWSKDWNFEAIRKIDGSLLSVTRYNKQWILRTRGTVDARQLPNGHEIDFLMDKYFKFFDCPYAKAFIDAVEHSWLFEWTTPTNIICIRESNEPELTLIGIVSHKDFKYHPQKYLDVAAEEYGFKRPERYHYDSVEECINDVTLWEGKEGVVIYSPDGQTLKKIKSEQYLTLHRVATGMKTVSNILDVFIASPKFVEYQDFYDYVETSLDHEVAEKIKDEMLQITDAYGIFVRITNIVERAIATYIGILDSRKKQAMAIQERFDGWIVPLAFHLLDNKPLDDKVIRKSMEKILGL